MLQVYNLYDLAFIYGISKSKLHYWSAGDTSLADNYYIYKPDGKIYTGYAGTMGTTPSGSYSTLSTPYEVYADNAVTELESTLASSSGATTIGTSTGVVLENRIAATETSLSGKAPLAGLSTQTFSVADATSDTQATSYKQLKYRTTKGGLTQSIASNALTLTQAIKTFVFRSSALTDGTSVEVTPSSVLSLTIPNGATLGGTSSVLLDIYVLALYNSGSVSLGVVNAGGGLVLDESGLISTTAISSSSTSKSVVYSTSAITSSPYIILDRLTVTLPTAGAWSILPTVISADLVSPALLVKRILTPTIDTSTGATSYAFTAIPSWAKRLTLQMVGVSTSATSGLLLKMGIGGVAQSSTYSSSGFVYSGTLFSSTSGFYAGYRGSAAGTVDGAITLTKQSDLSWTAQGYTHSANGGSCGGSCTLTGVADSLFLTTINGTDTFDAGTISLLIEG